MMLGILQEPKVLDMLFMLYVLYVPYVRGVLYLVNCRIACATAHSQA